MRKMHAKNAQVRPAPNKHLKRLGTDMECAGQEKLKEYWTSHCPDTDGYDTSVPTTPTIEYAGTPQTATISIESCSITLCSSTPKQVHPSNTDLSISFHPFTVGDSYTPAPHLSSHNQIPKYPHTGLFQQALPDIMQDLNVSRTDVTLLPSSSISTPFSSISTPF
jgi:hypothetical protein